MRIIAGPCQHESYEHSLKIATECKRVCDSFNLDYYFKASYDKANRTNIKGKRGVGLKQTMDDFYLLKDKLKVKTLTDVHDIQQVNLIQHHFNDQVDVLQIPAFLCRQTDLIEATCATDKIVNIKKGQFLAPWDVNGILSKTKNAREVWITERGTSFGYNRLVVDFVGLQQMQRDFPNVDFVFDATHSVQQPGGWGTCSGGEREFAPGLAKAAAAVGIENFFIEVHDDPDNAPSDGPNMIRLEDFESVIKQLVHVSHVAKNWELF